MENKNVEEKKVMALGKEMYKVENGRIYIESEELANAIQNEGMDLFVDEEAASNGHSWCGIGC
ncbi:hypothetical protein [Clostridium sp. KNHs214]|uniref:hypothetical protein n=1 Tax=Clostridium sp. KNHs214 TaxID=1540257 RepID=UPI0005586CDE|nr:hypothetical protein [Clostridium sp. KNHs214]